MNNNTEFDMRFSPKTILKRSGCQNNILINSLIHGICYLKISTIKIKSLKPHNVVVK